MTLTIIDKKSTLAKLLATENIEVQQNNVRTASFDVKNRILTIPIFKHENKDVLDMLIAHECSHALWTGLDDWKSICEESEEYKAYCNVLEDCRIDRMIQKKYPGIVKNYVNGYKELMRIDFFGVSNQNLNTLNLIDRINLYYKSSKSADITFDDANWVLDEIDNLKTLDDVKVLARKLLEQEKSKQKTKNTDDHSQEENQGNGDSNKSDNPNDEGETSYDDNKDNNNTSDDADDDNNEESNEDTTSGEGGTTNSVGDEKPENVAEDSKKTEENSDDILPQTSKNAENNSDKVTYNGNSFLKYFSLPDVDLKTAIISNSQFRKDHINHVKKVTTQEYSADMYMKYYKWLKNDFKKFKNDNLKTVNYLVKEFEMKKSATAYKRSSTDKTGVIDPLKLKNYKFSDDIFKRLTICPDDKNHGFIFLLDWSGSMFDSISQTIDQLINLIYFAKKINVPFEVYAFTEFGNGRYDLGAGEKLPHPYNYKTGDITLRSNVRLINLASHKLKKKELDDSMIALWLNRCCYKFEGRYSDNFYEGYPISYAPNYGLSSTPLNEGLIVLNKLIPMFKSKYSIEKMSLITLTDGYSNGMSRDIHNREYSDWTNGFKPGDAMIPVIKDGNKNYTLKKEKKGYYASKHYTSRDYTGLFIKMLKKKYNMIAVGFHIMKNPRYGASEYVHDTSDEKFVKQMRKGFFTAEIKNGYDEFWILNSKKLSVENNNKIDDIKEDMKPGQIKRLFAGGLKSKLQSRVVLNKFIERVA